MNLALHGFLLQVFVSILDFRHGQLLCSAGEPGYLDFDNLPETNFSCQGKVIGGYYADVEAGCQMFHVCTIGQKDEIMDIKFLCLNGTVFDQETRVCERVDEVDCSKSERFYNLNLELYGNNAVTLSLHENEDDEDDLTIDSVEDHQTRTTSARPSTTSTTSATTSRPSKPSTTAASGSFQHPAGYPQHYQPQPPFPQVHTSQSKSLYDDKNGGYHHQYIFHNGERANNQATSYQLFSNQGVVSSTTVSPTPSLSPSPQIHQIRYSSTVGPPPQIIHSESSTVTPLFHTTSSTIQTLLNSNVNSPAALINPIFHNHGIASTTEQFAVHSNNPRETSDYRDDDDDDQERDIRVLEAIQSANKGKISKLTISPVPNQQESSRTVQTKMSQISQQQQQRISNNFLSTPATIETTVKSFYPTPRPSPKPHTSQSVTHRVSQHIHVSDVTQLKPHQITINLPPPDIQRIVQNPSPLLPSQSRVIVTAKASVSDESGRPLNTTQLVTLPLPTIPASYDDYKEGDESFDPFYRDVPKIRKNRQNAMERSNVSRGKRSLEQPYHFIYETDNRQDEKNARAIRKSEPCQNEDNAMNKEIAPRVNLEALRIFKDSLLRYRSILFSDQVNEDVFRDGASEMKNDTESVKIDSEIFNTTRETIKQTKDNIIQGDHSDDLKAEASKHLALNRNEEKDEEANYEDSSANVKVNESLDGRRRNEETSEFEFQVYTESTTAHSKKNESRGDVIDIIILDSNNDYKVKAAKTDAPIEIIIEEETQSGTHDASNTEKVTHRGQIAGYLIKNESEKRSNSVAGEEKQSVIPRETTKRKSDKNSGDRKSTSRRKGPRSSRRRISSRIRQQKIENIEVAQAIQQKENLERTTTSPTIALPSSSTSATTVTPSSTPFKIKVVEQIDSNIFGELDSQTFKEIDTRAIGQHDASYSKSLQDSKSQNVKNNEKERSFDSQIVNDPIRSLELQTDKTDEEKQKTESTHTQNTERDNTIFTENPPSTELGLAELFKENKSDIKFSSEISDDEEVNASINEEEIEESTQDAPCEIYSDEITTSREDKREESSFRENPSNRSSIDISDEERTSAMKYSEEVNSEELNEYQEITEPSAENTQSIQEDYKDPESTESPTTSDYTNFEEYIDIQEDITVSTEEIDPSTEGVLKFTDELPIDYEEYAETEKDTSTSDESGAHEYVDDNYEPENYKGTESTIKSGEIEEETNDEEKKDVSEKDLNKNVDLQRVDDSADIETQTEYTIGTTEIENFHEIALTTFSTTAASTTSTTTTESSTTSTMKTPIATTTSTTTTTRRPPATTSRTTPSKLFKPTGNRRIYAYVPPTTTPVPVVIKPRLGLFNPKPAKPPKSYNELAPKPTIRKLLLSRKPTTTTAAATTVITTTEKINTENPDVATEPVTMTPATLTTTETLITVPTVTTITEIPTTEAVSTTTTATESGRSEENGLESKLEANEDISLDPSKNNQTNEENQLPSSSEQNNPIDSSDVDTGITKIEAFTPYPLSGSSTLESSIEGTTEKEIKPQEITEDADIFTTVPSTTLLPEKFEYPEITPSTEKYLEVTETTTAASASEQETPSVPERATTVLPKAEDTDPVASMEAAIVRSSNRKSTNSRRHASFNCLEREMYRFYGDARDCRLFHYCSPGFTSRQVLDFRFVCEEGTAFDEVTQSCRHDVRNRKCRNRFT